MKLNLTEKLVQDYVITEGKRQEVLFDFELPRFGVSVTARGAKSYVIVYRDTEGKQRQEKLADFGAITLSAARAVAKSRLEVIEAMKSPLGRRRSSCPTMDTFFFKTFLPLVKTQSRSYETHASIYRNHLQQVFGGLRLDDITEEVVLEFNSSLATKRVAFKNAGSRTLAEGTVKRIMILLRHILNEAIRHKGNTLTHNPTHVLKLKTVRKIKGKFLTRGQLRALLKAAGESLNTDLPDIIRVMGTTGLRRENVLAMRWEWGSMQRVALCRFQQKTTKRRKVLYCTFPRMFDSSYRTARMHRTQSGCSPTRKPASRTILAAVRG